MATIWLTLEQRTLFFETYFLPAPRAAAEDVYEQLLRRNQALRGVHFWIGAEDALYLGGSVAAIHVSDDELDRVIGAVYAAVERCFRSALRIGFPGAQ